MGTCCRSTCTSSSRGAAKQRLRSGVRIGIGLEDPCKKKKKYKRWLMQLTQGNRNHPSDLLSWRGEHTQGPVCIQPQLSMCTGVRDKGDLNSTCRDLTWGGALGTGGSEEVLTFSWSNWALRPLKCLKNSSLKDLCTAYRGLFSGQAIELNRQELASLYGS